MNIPYNMRPGYVRESSIPMLDEMVNIYREMKLSAPKGPRIDENTWIRAGLNVFAQDDGSIAKIEQVMNRDLLWDSIVPDDVIMIANPQPLNIDFCIPHYAELKPEPKQFSTPWSMTYPLAITAPMKVTV